MTEVQSQTDIVESITETNGTLVVKAHKEDGNGSGKLFDFVSVLTSLDNRLGLNRYSQLRHTDPCKIRIISYLGGQYRLDTNAIRASKLDHNLKLFLKALKKRLEVESVSKDAGIITITIKPEVVCAPKKAIPFMEFVTSKAKDLSLSEYLKFKLTNPHQLEVTSYSGLEYHIDMAALHADRLRVFFRKVMDHTDVTNSVDYLQKLGWHEKQFSDLGVSRATFYRYKADQPAIRSHLIQ